MSTDYYKENFMADSKNSSECTMNFHGRYNLWD